MGSLWIDNNKLNVIPRHQMAMPRASIWLSSYFRKHEEDMEREWKRVPTDMYVTCT